MTTDFRYVASSSLLIALLCSGCSDPDAAVTTDMHEDFDHEHKHQHTDNDDHEHEHEDGVRGSHSHGHTHNHRHGEPLHDGHIVSIGHTHHQDRATRYHAEVMPLSDNTIRFHLLTESDEGESGDYPIEVSEIPALISIRGHESVSSELSFVGVGDGDRASEFSLTIPNGLAEANEFSVMIPSVSLGGQRQNFSFTVRREMAENNKAADDPAAAGSLKETSDE